MRGLTLHLEAGVEGRPVRERARLRNRRR